MVGNVRSAVLTENVCFDEKLRFVGLTRKVFFRDFGGKCIFADLAGNVHFSFLLR